VSAGPRYLLAEGIIREMEVRYERSDAVAVITLDRPQARNAVTIALFDGLAEAVAQAHDDGARALVLTGAGGYFCAGLDIKQLQSSAGNEATVLGAVLEAGKRAVLAIAQSPLPSVSAVEGGALGGGLALALCTDVCLAGAGARLSTQYARVGTTTDLGLSHTLTRRLGPGRSASQLLRSPTLDAGQALALGLIDEIVADGGALDAALGVAADLATRSPTLVAGMRELAGTALGHTFAEHLDAEQAWIHRGWADPTAQAYAAAFAKRTADPGSWSSTSGL